LGALAVGVSDAGEAPASTCQEATSVAPFQLAATVSVPAAPDWIASAGVLAGWPLHDERYVRKFCTFLPSVASNRTCPEESNSVKFGSLP